MQYSAKLHDEFFYSVITMCSINYWIEVETVVLLIDIFRENNYFEKTIAVNDILNIF